VIQGAIYILLDIKIRVDLILSVCCNIWMFKQDGGKLYDSVDKTWKTNITDLMV
jgi:hypothetical protein